MADVSERGSISAVAGAVSINLEDNPAVGLEITGTWVGTIIVRATINGVDVYTPAVSSPTGGSGASSFTANGRTLIFAPGASRVIVSASAWTSGIATVVMKAGDGTPSLAAGGGGGGGAVTAADGDIATLGTTTDAGVTTDTTGTVIGFLRGNIIKWVNFLSRFPAALGGTTSAASLPVVLSSDGPFATQTGSVTETVPATDTASSGLNGRLQRIAQRLTSLIALVPAALTGSGNFKVSVAESTASQAVTNANLDAALSTLLTISDFDTKTGSLTETAPASDTASSGGNGRLQRIAQRLTSLIALLPSALVGGRLDVNIGAPATLPVSIAASADSAGGATTDAAVVSDANGSRNAFLRGLVKIFADIWDSTLHFLHVRSGTYEDLLTVTLTRPANTTAYAAGRAITDTGGTVRTITGAARVSGGTGALTHLTIAFSDNWATKPQLEIWVFDTTLTPQTDNAAAAPADAELLTLIGIIPVTAAFIGDATANSGNMGMDSGAISLPFKTVGSANLFFTVVVRNAAQAGANSGTMTCRFTVRQN